MKTSIRTGHRLSEEKINFRFDGKAYEGYAGDTANPHGFTVATSPAANARPIGASIMMRQPVCRCDRSTPTR